MCKDSDQDIPPRTPKNLPPAAEKPVRPEGNVEPPKHETKFSTNEEYALQGKEKFSDVALSDVTESA